MIINGCSTNVLGKSSFENHVFWIIKYLKYIFLFFSQQLPTFPKETLFYATASDISGQKLALKISGWSLLQCGHHFYHRALFMSMYQMMFWDRGIQGPCWSWRTRFHSLAHWGFSGVSKKPKLFSFFKSGIQELWKELWIDTDVVCLSGAYVVVVEISADQLALQ